MSMPRRSKNEPVEYKSHQSGRGSRQRIILYRLGDFYGVLVRLNSGIILTPSFNQPNATYRSVAGNEKDIIDWVSLEEADRRYARLVLADIQQAGHIAHHLPAEGKRTVPYLRLVQ